MRAQLEQFLLSPRKQATLHHTFMEAYCRKSIRIIEGRRSLCFDIAAISVEKDHQRKGHFRRFIKLIERLSTQHYLFIECVHAPLLQEILTRYNFQRIDDENNNYYKKLRP